jgi:hypothetical protein
MPLPTDRVQVKTAGWLKARDRALSIGDVHLARAVTADLLRIGYREQPEPLETTVPEPLETAVPARPRRGRPPKPQDEESTDGFT